MLNKVLQKEIYLFIRKTSGSKISSILKSLELASKIELKSVFSRDSMLKLLIFSKLKGIHSHVKLNSFLNNHHDDAIC